MMAMGKRGFDIEVETNAHRISIRFRGRWTPEIAQEYLAACQRTLSELPSDREEPWTMFLDLADFTLPPPEVLDWLERGFLNLKELDIRRQAVVLHGPIIHLPGMASLQAGSLVLSYFQSEDEALEWLMEGSDVKHAK